MNTTQQNKGIPAKGLLLGDVDKVVRQGELSQHSHNKAELYICLGGSATDNVNGVESAVLPGDVYVLTSNVSHGQSHMTDFRCCIFKFDMELLQEQAGRFRLTEKPGFQELFINDVRDREAGLNTSNLFVDLDTTKYAEQVADMMKVETDSDILDIMFLSLISLICTRCRRKHTGESRRAYEDIAEVAYYIEHNFKKSLTLEELAKLSHYSGRHFTRLMRERYGMSPMEYLDAVRMKNACDLLLHTTLNVIQIAQMCGFEDNNLFSRHFRAAKGMSPTMYRKKNQVEKPKLPTVSSIDILE